MTRYFVLIGLLLCGLFSAQAKSYYFNEKSGSDQNSGLSPEAPFLSLKKINELKLQPGDSVLLSAGQTFKESLVLRNIIGNAHQKIVVGSYGENDKKAIIDAAGFLNGILIQDCAYLTVENLKITANGKDNSETVAGTMRCGVLVKTSKAGTYESISLEGLDIQDVFYEDPGFRRGKDEVRTANGTQRYGWGIRFINRTEGALLKNVKVRNCRVKNVAHTGIKFTAFTDGIQGVEVSDCRVLKTGGPGIQMSGVYDGNVKNCVVNYSGSKDDSRKWGRGSGLWTWGSSNIIIEHNEFRNANGPGDSAGCHIDFNCRNVIVQYNFSNKNAGGFIEILGNNFNCAYRYNISVDDGHRIKGENGAFQEGKTFWLSGYRGDKKRSGPFNSYIYNNTIYVSDSIDAKIAVTRVAKGVMVANNIFYIKGESQAVLGDQYKPEKDGSGSVRNVVFKNNLFLKTKNWPQEVLIQDEAPQYGNPDFMNPGGNSFSDYVPQNKSIIRNRGIKIPVLPGDSIGLVSGLKVEKDIFGHQIKGKPDMGAVEL
ncbi:right-handed parallel beta-helix repeat-containing protein [Marinilabilia rubra]|uniref:Right-handed parallel beta-helix repeat-containing protein n=1 Tax=Marinilabilia rubra TaxID=2162893 RepID=A0A2U2B777_9BACT|nr:right-handed parallel beta-helix repeat-containing protein [Marinilabilia rubra]PWD98918.1 right-handed parallel beta-helix repeat-containing protein [Marinilabilia rubra]